MRRLQNITAEPVQRHTIVFQESEVVVTIRLYPRSQLWALDAEYKDWSIHGIKLSLGVLHMASQNKPFDFIVEDNSGAGIDPFQSIDFSSGRCDLYMLDPEEMEIIRGAEVPL